MLQGFGSSALVEFKCGKMTFDGKRVKPDRRKGLLKIVNEGQIKKLQWCDADTKTPIDNLYLMPGEAKFEKVKQSNDRVYLLEFTHTSQRFFYWMQEEDSTKDKELADKVNNLINGR